MLSASLLRDAFGAPYVYLDGTFSQDVFTLQSNLSAVGALTCSGKCDGIVGPKTTLALLQVLDHIPGVPSGVSAAIASADSALQPVGLVGTLKIASYAGADELLNPLYGFISDNAGLLAVGVGIYMAQLGKVPPASGSTPAPTGLPPGITMLHVDTGALAKIKMLPYRAGTITAFDPAIGKFRIAVPKGKAPPGFQGATFDFGAAPAANATHVEVTPQANDNPALQHVALSKLLVSTGEQSPSFFSSPLTIAGAAVGALALIAGAWWLLK